MFQHGRVIGPALVMGALLLAGAGCSDRPDGGAPDVVGSVRVHVVNARVSAGDVTRVTITTTSGFVTDLERGPDGEAFTGSMILPVGPTELLGQAFIEDTLVAESQPTPVVIEEGAVTSVMLRLLDLTGGDGPDHGPLIVSLTHPETVLAGQEALFSVSAVDPDGEPATIAWSSDCADASFSDPGAADTRWVKSAEGACEVTVTVSAGGLSASESFGIVVFGSGGTGAVDIGGVIVSAPQLFLALDYGARCEVFPGVANASCPAAIPSTESAFLSVSVSWGNAEPGVLEVFDDCGGSFEPFFLDPFGAEGLWAPPSATGLCMVSVRAASPDGVSAELAAAIVVRRPPGPPEPPPPAYVRASLRPLVQLTPQAEFGRFDILGRPMQTSDFQSAATLVSMEQKITELGVQIGAERGLGALELFIDAENRTRAALIPFRGKPSDVDVVVMGDARKAYVPLGGSFGSPGNEVAAVDLGSNSVVRVRVGVRPQRLAVHHPSGLVFVCNQFSNYISIIDARFDELLRDGGLPVEIPTDFHCTDLAVVERDPAFGEPDEIYLYVANGWRGSVLKYSIDVLRDINDAPAGVHINPAPGRPAHEPLAEIVGVGASPARLRVSESQSLVYVAGRRGGEVATIEVVSDAVLRRVALGAPAADVLQIADKVCVPTTTPFRGLLSGSAAVIPGDVDAPPVEVIGLDGQSHVVHPGSLFDQTDSYGFEDVRSGIFQINANLSGSADYITDDSERDDFFASAQKRLAGAVPQAIVRTAAGDRVYVALSGSDLIQELRVGSGELRLEPTGLLMETAEVPVALALDEDTGLLLAATRGGDMLQIFEAASGQLLEQVDLGYAQPRFPATTIEAGEYLFQTAKWTNDARKACTSCHFDEGITDGLSFSSGTTAPTAYHKVKPVWNLLETDGYGWNASSASGSQASLAIEAQTRTNCELVLYGLVEGPDSDPFLRVGDPVNVTSGVDDASCQPNTFLLDGDGLPTSMHGDTNGDGVDDFGDISDFIAAQRQIIASLMPLTVQEQLARAGLALDRVDMVRAIDYFTVSELRLPPNPLADPGLSGVLYPELQGRLASGEDIFRNQAQCDGCHDPDNSRHPFSDGRAHGGGASFIRDFIVTYDQDPRLIFFDPILANGVPAQMLISADYDFTPQEVDFHHNPLDFLIPFCFDAELCLTFGNPLAVRGSDEETERLRRLLRFFVANPDGGFIPGQVVGQPRVDTPSLRGAWFQGGLLRHGHAQSVREAVLAPGHVALQDGERGLAVDRRGSFDVHGMTSALSPEQVDDLILYVESIE